MRCEERASMPSRQWPRQGDGPNPSIHEKKEVYPMLQQTNLEKVHLLPGLFRERQELNRAYLKELKNQQLLQNFWFFTES